MIYYDLTSAYFYSQNLITGFSYSDIPAGKKSIYNYLPKLEPKQTPDSLAELINEANEAAGAYIYILERDNTIKYATNKFYLAALQISFKERVQLLDTFEGENISFFGESLKIYNFSGVALDYASSTPDTYKFFHQSSLIHLYNNKLRGTLLVKNGAIAVLKVLNHLVYGYPINLSVAYNSSLDKMAQFNMSWVTLKHTLQMPYVVNTKNLEEMYLNISKKENKHYKFIEDFLKVSDDLLIMKQWPVLEQSKDLENIINKLGIYTLNTLTYSTFLYLKKEEQNLLVTTLKKYFEKYKDFVTKYIKKTENEEVEGSSVLLLKWFKNENFFNSEFLNFLDLKTPQHFNTLKSVLSIIIKVKDELLILKSRTL